MKVSGAHQYYYGFNNWDHCDDSCPGYQASARRRHQKVGASKWHLNFIFIFLSLCVKVEPEPEPEPTSTCVAWTGQDTDGGKPCVFPFEYKVNKISIYKKYFCTIFFQGHDLHELHIRPRQLLPPVVRHPGEGHGGGQLVHHPQVGLLRRIVDVGGARLPRFGT